MITDWFAQAPLTGLALLVVFGPGLLLGAALRLRGLWLWASAPAVSAGALALLAIVFPVLGLRWSHLGVGVAVVLLAAVVWAVSALVRRGRPRSPYVDRRREKGLLLLGLIVGAGVNAGRLLTYVGTPGAISQTNDAVFHLNALRWIDMTGSASSFDVSGLVGGSFYPSAWHALASLVAVDIEAIPVAANVLSLVIAAVVWPLAVVLLARVISRGNPLVTALAAALSAGLMAFPQLMFEWGVLYPYALSVAVVPAAVGLTIMTVRSWTAAEAGARWRTSAGFAAASVLAIVATALAQPSTVLVWAALVMLWLTDALLRVRRPALSAVRRALPIAAIVLGWLMVALVWAALSYLAGPVLWRAYRSPLEALLDVVTNSHSLLPPALAMSALLLVGIVRAVRVSRLRWLLVAWLGISLLYVISVSTDLPVIKRLLTGPWYGDSFRLAAIVPIVVAPLAAIGLDALIRWGAERLRQSAGAGVRRALTASALALTAVVGAISIAVAPVVLLRVGAETDEHSRYAIDDDTYLSADEYALLRELPALVPDDALLIANPSTGAAFAFVLGERDIVPRTWSPPQSVAWDTIAADLRNAGEDAAVCEALAAYGAPSYVLDFGPGDTGPGQYMMRGMTDFEGQAGFELIAEEGDASLWRITACG